jgi:signal transduction histidine kinase
MSHGREHEHRRDGLQSAFSSAMPARSLGRVGQYPRHRRDRRLVVAVAVSFSLMLVSFVASRTITELQSRRIQREASSISENALLAAEALISIRTSLRKLVFTLNRLGAASSPEVVLLLGSELEVARGDVATSWARYVSFPFYSGERSLAERVEPELASVEQAIDGVVERLRTGDREGALGIAASSALPSIETSDTGVASDVELNRREASLAATRIAASTRERGLLPEVVGAFFAVAAAYFGVRVLARYLAWSAARSAELEQFAGRVAHDIRSPLGSVSLTLELVKKRERFDARTQELLDRVTRTMENVKRLIDDLLVFATAGGHLVPGEGGERKANVREALDGVVDDAQLEAEKTGIRIEYERPDPALVVACGPGVLISITTNLVSNALKFLGDARQRRVSISARQARKDVYLDVIDTGPGLAPELREKVFQPHVRGNSREPGFGLGLATVKKLVEVHGGDVRVDAGPEGGCRFTVRLPVWTPPPAGRRWVLRRLSRVAT